MDVKEKLTPARAQFLRDAQAERGVHAVEHYPPAKWALEKGYVRLVEGRLSSRQHFITPEGAAALQRGTS